MAAVHQSTPQEVIKLVATYLNSVVAENDKLPKLVSPTKFHARSVPSIDLLSYLSRILKYAPCGSECFLAVLVYFDRIANLSLGVSPADDLAGLKDSLEQTHISKTYKKVTINSYTIHRLLITASLVSMKFLSDVFYTNLHMSRTCLSNSRCWRASCARAKSVGVGIPQNGRFSADGECQ